MINRRALFKKAAVGAAAAPMAAQQAAMAVVSSQAISPIGGTLPGQYPVAAVETAWDKAAKELMRLARNGKLPEWKRKEMMAAARYRARWIDHDLLSLQSISNTARYAMQVDREFRSQIIEADNRMESESAFRKMVDGFRSMFT